jgi:hypothetical protein
MGKGFGGLKPFLRYGFMKMLESKWKFKKDSCAIVIEWHCNYSQMDFLQLVFITELIQASIFL